MEVVMPQIGMTMTEGTIEQWLVSDGDTVKKGDPMMEISTEKLNNTIECPADGVIKILVEEGESVECGEPVAQID
jgi:pyruvate/2-oxoglutarate dehydrogenase complex dihydrolipoamide acyltransferase (E2) component